jgi:serine protease AprX
MKQKNLSHPAPAADEMRQPIACEPLEARCLFQAAPWGPYAKYIYQDMAASAFSNLTGKGQTVAVIDTGISTRSSSLNDGKVVAGYNFIDNNKNYQDTDGHGTAVAGLLAGRQFTYQGNRYRGIAPGAKLVALKVDDGVNDPPADRIRAALQWVVNNRVKYHITAINISEGMGSYGSKFTGPDYGDLLADLEAVGVFTGAAAGNESDRTNVDYPGADVSAFSVGSTDLSDNLSSFTNAGAALDILAPGQSLIAPTLANGRTIYMSVEGTSFSTPLVVGAAVLVHQADPFLSPTQILSVLQNTPFHDNDPIGGGTYARLDLYNSLYVAKSMVQTAKKAVFAK